MLLFASQILEVSISARELKELRFMKLLSPCADDPYSPWPTGLSCIVVSPTLIIHLSTLSKYGQEISRV